MPKIILFRVDFTDFNGEDIARLAEHGQWTEVSEEDLSLLRRHLGRSHPRMHLAEQVPVSPVIKDVNEYIAAAKHASDVAAVKATASKAARARRAVEAKKKLLASLKLELGDA